MPPYIQNSKSSSWSSLANRVVHLTARQNFPSNSNFPDRDNGLHPAAIFGIVAGVMFVLIIGAWIMWFTLIKKALTHRDYGVLPSLRTAANGRRHGHSNSMSGNYPPYGPGGGDNQYGGYGNATTQYPPAAHHAQNPTPPPYDWSRHPEQSSNGLKDENRGHDSGSHGMSSSGNGFSGPN
ncbi:hypothetical protein QBC37DRAFT_367338 [Rhypophila decipiens]|uniref:Uncharacterized protein n=1 Tax=Rhypophila decipiens TaxID=261697 RepID=A0AAN6YKC2_9PEZI|nr:hypothetical protein QBC37DRAFT_367338 [Rhypophila decipiens]